MERGNGESVDLKYTKKSWSLSQISQRIMHQSFEPHPPAPKLGDTQGIHFYCQYYAVKAPSCGEKIPSELPRPVNIRCNSLKRLHFLNKWSFHRIFFIPQKSRLLFFPFFPLRQLFSPHVFCEYATWTQSSKRVREPRLRIPSPSPVVDAEVVQTFTQSKVKHFNTFNYINFTSRVTRESLILLTDFFQTLSNALVKFNSVTKSVLTRRLH